MKTLNLLQFIANRAKEPSTWAALLGLAAITGNPLPAFVPDVVMHLATGVAGALGVFLAERKA
jgi:hypothetical protein